MLFFVLFRVQNFCCIVLALLTSGNGMVLVCTQRFRFLNFAFFFYSFYFIFILFFLYFYLPTTFTHTHDPRPTPTTHTHDPRPLPTTHDPRHLATLRKTTSMQLPWGALRISSSDSGDLAVSDIFDYKRIA